MMPEITIKSTYSVTGQATTHAVNPEDLVSVTMPLQPAVVNPRHVRRLRAKDWRHRETGWYEEEHRVLTKLSRVKPHHRWLVHEMRLLMYAAFVKEAEARSLGRLLTSSRKRYIKEYDSFFKKWQRAPLLPPIYRPTRLAYDPDDYLRVVHPWSYFEHRQAFTRPVNVQRTATLS